MLRHSNLVFPFLGKSSHLLSIFPKFHFRRSFSVTASSPKPSSSKSARKALRDSPSGVLRHSLDMCSKRGDLSAALELYDEARLNGVSLSQHHYNVLLYLCAEGQGSGLELGAARRGSEIFRQMVLDDVEPNEASFSTAARLAEDPETAFELVKQMQKFGIVPKLRSYGPALFGFCNKLDAKMAFEVDAHMVGIGVQPEEAELAALIKVGAGTGNGDKVYETMHRLRAAVRQVSEATAEVVEGWFLSEAAGRVGAESWDKRRVKETMVSRGGGWHGLGWLRSGKWNVVRTGMDENGVCLCCNQRLVCIDIDPGETVIFAASLARLAAKREASADFVEFQEWLKRHGPFDAIVDGANVSLVKQDRFNFFHLKSFVHQLRDISPSKKMPLVILHKNRAYSGPGQNPRNAQLLESWKKSGSFYATPVGSNDDWYWLYAAVSNNCLILTNDEMRDHLFQLLGTSFFPRWKEKHQVRLSVTNGLKLHMPPSYSIIIQESEKGGWHIPTVTGDDLESPRQWLCATRATNNT